MEGWRCIGDAPGQEQVFLPFFDFHADPVLVAFFMKGVHLVKECPIHLLRVGGMVVWFEGIAAEAAVGVGGTGCDPLPVA